ncbi:MAG: undecaprenyl/decaprenyl-phosphate alpha-N-acetylglucosaminyl 1-phosphate transferase [Chitinispirillaceae bacterium]|nr:undecaprenyl/decaprenyl-phosphate alpha-N-acetylglucosaminyl 1-phosphate transferase [Chitinispirillaceae bacterium]
MIKYLIFLAGAAVCSGGIIYLLLKSSVVDLFKDKPSPRKIHHHPIPRLGGVALITAFLVFTAITALFNQRLSLLSTVPATAFSAILLASVAILIIGFLDDTPFVTIRVRHKLFMEVFIAFTAVYLLNVNIGRLSFFGAFAFPLWLSNIVSFLWIIGLANAYNIIDGLDGLAGSLSLIAIMTLAIIAGIGGQSSTVFLSIILSGAIVGFLVHNMPPAKTFMGDAGSLFLGTMIAILSLHIGKTVTPGRAFIVMPLIAAIPIIEVLITMVRRYCKTNDKKAKRSECIHSMVIPDSSHIHHRFLYRGYSQLQSTVILFLLALSLCCGALCCFLAPLRFIPAIILYLMVPVVLTLDRLGFGGRFKKALRISKSRYNGYRITPLIGVIDQGGAISDLLAKKSGDEIGYINLSEAAPSDFPQHLHAAVLHYGIPSADTINKAETLSSILCRPVFVVEEAGSDKLFFKEVSKNGSLIIREKTGPVEMLIKDLQYAALAGKIRHLPPVQPPATLIRNHESRYAEAC